MLISNNSGVCYRMILVIKSIGHACRHLICFDVVTHLGTERVIVVTSTLRSSCVTWFVYYIMIIVGLKVMDSY